MESNGMEKIYRLADLIMRIAYINLLTLLFMLLGLVIFGFFPALTAAFYIIRKWLTGHSDIQITKNYWIIYKKEFLKSNIIGFILFVIGSLLYVNLSIAEVVQLKLIHYSYYPILLVTILFFCACLYVFPIYLHYNVSIIQIFKNSILLLFFRPLNTIFMIASVFLLYHLIMTIPGLIPFFSINIFVMITTFFALKTFQKLQMMQEEAV